MDNTIKVVAVTGAASKRKDLPFVSHEMSDLYRSFMALVFDNQIYSVKQREDATSISLIFADETIISRNMESGIISIKKVHPESAYYKRNHIVPIESKPLNTQTDAPGKSFGLKSFKLLSTNAQIRRFVVSSWEKRFEIYYKSTGLDICRDESEWLNNEIDNPSPTNEKYKNRHNLWVTSNQVAERNTKSQNGPIVKYIIKNLWNFLYDAPIARLTIAYFGVRANLTDYNFVARYKQQLALLERESPNLIRLVGWSLDAVPIEKLLSSDNNGYMVVIHAIRSHLFESFGKNKVKLTAAGWKFITRCSRPYIDVICSHSNEFVLICDHNRSIVNSLGRANLTPPLKFFKEYARANGVRYLNNNMRDLNENPDCFFEDEIDFHRSYIISKMDERFMHLAARKAIEAAKKKSLLHFVSHEFSLTNDWYLTTSPTLYRNSTWESLMRQQRLWHEQFQLEQQAEAGINDDVIDGLRWTNHLGTFSLKGIQVRELSCGAELREEGRKMQHCVASYAMKCQSGAARIFSLAKAIKGSEYPAQATLEIVIHPPLEQAGIGRSTRRAYHIGQIRGIQNSKVSRDMASAGKIILRMLRKKCM